MKARQQHPIPEAGTRFFSLAVIQQVKGNEPRLKGARCVQCRCDCGNETVVAISKLVAGSHRSCGCWRKNMLATATLKHGKSQSVLYRLWRGMLNRCRNPNCKDYGRYGGRGIQVCDFWTNDFEAFARDMGERPTRGHTVDRINNDGNYEPGNVRWATPKEQAQNRRPMTLPMKRKNREVAAPRNP